MDLGFAFRFLNTNSMILTMHTHNYYEYFLIVSGAVVHMVNDTETILSPGDLIFIRPKDFHGYRLLPDVDCDMINISFRAVHFDSLLAYLGEKQKNQISDPAMPPKINLINLNVNVNDSHSLFEHLLREHEVMNFYMGDDQSLLLYLKMLLFETVKVFVNVAPDHEKPDSTNHLLTAALEKMNSQTALEEGLPALIRFMGVSHGHLCRIMKEHLHTTPAQYIIDKRMIYASNMLIRSDLNILSISQLVGYQSLSCFISTFKKKYEMTPSRYRTLYRIPYIG